MAKSLSITERQAPHLSLIVASGPRGQQAGDELKRGADLQRLFAALSNAHLERLLARLRSERLAGLINHHGDIDFPSRLLCELLRAAPSLAAFVRAPLRFPRAWLRRRARQDESSS